MRRAAVAIVFSLIVFGAHAALAGMDYRCLAACQQAGYKHIYCAARCAVQTPNQSINPAAPKLHGTDFRCVDKCTGTGRNREYCLKNCAY